MIRPTKAAGGAADTKLHFITVGGVARSAGPKKAQGAVTFDRPRRRRALFNDFGSCLDWAAAPRALVQKGESPVH